MGTVLWTIGSVLRHFTLHLQSTAWDRLLPVDLVAGGCALVSLVLWWYLRGGERDPRAVADLGMTYMIATAFAIGVLLHWGPAPGDTLSTEPRITWIGPLILMFAAIAPVSPWRIFSAGFVAASMDPLGMVIWKAAGSYDFGAMHNLLIMHYPSYLLLGVAVVISHVVTRLGQQVGRERELGSYRLGELLGSGGMGAVYRASHRMLARPAAIKLIRPDVLASLDGGQAELATARFRREAEAAAHLRSPHTVELYDFGVSEDGALYAVMELLEGTDLEALVRRDGPLPADRVVRLLLQVCESLEEAHVTGLVHRDIKPSNIHVGRLGLRDDFVKVLDFGLVKRVAEPTGEYEIATQVGLAAGTPAYMAPEMASDEGVDGRADLYSLGCVAFYLLTGRLVFEAGSALQMIACHLYETPEPPSRYAPDVPPALDRLVLACLAKRPAERPGTAGEVARALLAIEREIDEMTERHLDAPFTGAHGSSFSPLTTSALVRTLAAWVVTTCFLAGPLAAQAHPARVALVLDQRIPRFDSLVGAFQHEILGFFRPGEITLENPVAGDGTAAGIERVLQQTLGDSSLAAVVTLGPIGSHLLARAGEPPRPAVAAIIVDAALQGLPQKDDASGIRNLTYVDESRAVSGTIAEFHRMIPFRRMAILLDPELLKAIPQIEATARERVRPTGADGVVLPARGTADQILASLPEGTDAVYLTILPALSEDETHRLIAGLNARRLPTLSHLVDPDVPAGALASYEPPDGWLHRARRVAVDLQRILAGEDAGTLPVQLVGAPRLTLNLATARAIGFSPGYRLLTDAALVGTDSLGPADTVSLAEAMRGAVATNLDLKAADLEVASGRQNVRLARSNLLPDIESQIGATRTRDKTAAASLGQQPERVVDGGISFSMPLYSEQAWAGYGSERKLQQGREAERNQVRLDIVLDAAEAYLTVLQARTVADVRRSNLYRNRSNLEIAQLRETVGSSSRADIYRWEGEVANARRDVISAESQVRVATLELKRVLNRPLDQPLAQQPVTLGDPALLAQDSTVLTWFDDPALYGVLTKFLVDEALRISPELAQADAAIAAQERQRTAAGRAFWMPTFSLQGGLNNVFSRGGAGSTSPTLPGNVTLPTAPDMSWQFRVQASLPLFTGFERTATRAQTGLDLERLRVERAGAALSVEQRVRAALETAGSSYAAIALTRDASEAASRNYELVSDAYARGTASITALLDAQNAAESSAESAANAVHDFLLDLMRVERAMGDFGVLRSAEQQQAFLQRLHTLEEQR
jgi:outer membrane protein TolC/ABC-type uncharacterized transport system substrate-binding protein